MNAYRDDSFDADPESARQRARPSYRPPVGIPAPWRERPLPSAVVSVALHALIIFLLLVPVFTSDAVQDALREGAGGPGAAGGGGGGRRGTGGPDVPERLRYIQVAPAPAPAPTPQPAVPRPTPPKPVPVPKPAPPKPVVVPPPVQSTPPPDAAAEPPSAPVDVAINPGTGGGTGNDGTAGTGPGTGGGVGAGDGTGRGSGVGPGTGGGAGSIHPPMPTQLLLPPFNAPSKVRGRQIPVTFDVDSTGSVLSIDFPSTGDGGYNRRFREQMAEYRFRPAVRADDGVPVRAKVVVTVTL